MTDDQNVVYVIEWKRTLAKMGKHWNIKEAFLSKDTATTALAQYRIHEQAANNHGWQVEYRLTYYVRTTREPRKKH